MSQLMSNTKPCPVCGQHRENERRMRQYNMGIIDFIREQRIVKMDSCILCVKKHVGRAMVYYEEMLTAKDSGKEDGTASVNVPMNHLKVIGHLGCAVEESEDFAELHQELLQMERDYRYEGIAPDWVKLANMIEQATTSRN